MEKLDLNLSLGLPKSGQEIASPTQLNPMLTHTPIPHQAVENGESGLGRRPIEAGDVNNVNVNLMVSSFIMSQFAVSRSASPTASVLVGGGPPPPHNPNAEVRNDYVLIDVPLRRAEREFVAGNHHNLNACDDGKIKGPVFETKHCTNYNCATKETPMWRRGPLGPKTLCNACGIKYRKEEEKKKARMATRGLN